jgi:adenine phosphoribosyltransferase
MRWKSLIRTIPGFPKAGIRYRDITPLLASGTGFRHVIHLLADRYAGKVDKVVGIEARGFIFGAAIAHQIGAGFVPVRKPGKLPAEKVSESYDLEYGTDRLEMHADAVAPGERVLIADDVIATGGTALATARMVEALGGEVAGFGFIVELTFLPGRAKLAGYDVESLIRY